MLSGLPAWKHLHDLARPGDLRVLPWDDGAVVKRVTSTARGVYLVHEEGQPPVEGVAVYNYDYRNVWQCERDGAFMRPDCSHIWRAKHHAIGERLKRLLDRSTERLEAWPNEPMCVACGAIPDPGSDECPKCQKQLDKEIRRTL